MQHWILFIFSLQESVKAQHQNWCKKIPLFLSFRLQDNAVQGEKTRTCTAGATIPLKTMKQTSPLFTVPSRSAPFSPLLSHATPPFLPFQSHFLPSINGYPGYNPWKIFQLTEARTGEFLVHCWHWNQPLDSIGFLSVESYFTAKKCIEKTANCRRYGCEVDNFTTA